MDFVRQKATLLSLVLMHSARLHKNRL